MSIDLPRGSRSGAGGARAGSTARRHLATLAVALATLAGCSSDRTAPEEFPPVELGMNREAVRDAVLGGDATAVEESERSLVVVGRDRRVAEETFLFHNDRLAAWTARYADAADRGNFQRLARRFDLSYGEPEALTDDGLVLQARWRMPEGNGHLLLSAFVGGRGEDAPLMIRVQDPAVVGRLIQELNREQEREIEDSPDAGSRAEPEGETNAEPEAP